MHSYACAKAATELIRGGYGKNLDTPLIIMPGNSGYAPRQFHILDKCFDITCCRLSTRHKEIISRDGRHLRNNVFILLVWRNYSTPCIYNVGRKTEKTNLQVVPDNTQDFEREGESEINIDG